MKPLRLASKSIDAATWERCLESCGAHFRPSCDVCFALHRLGELAADPFADPPRFFLCPLCRADLGLEVLNHIIGCATFADRPR